MQILILDTRDNFTMPPTKSSEVWEYYTISGNTVKCHFCSLNLSYNPKGGTGNLVRHIKRKHNHINIHLQSNNKSVKTSPIIERITTKGSKSTTKTKLLSNPEDFILPISKKVSSSSPSKQKAVPLSKTPQKPKTVYKSNVIEKLSTNSGPLAEQRSSEIDYQLLKMIVKEYHPFQIVEDPEFRNLIYLLCPTYKIPTKEALSSTLLPAIHEKLKTQMQDLIKPDLVACITVEGWTSHNNQNHFYAVTSHFIDENTTLQKVFLDCILYQDQHTSDIVSQTLKDVVSQWGLEQNIVAIVTDSDSDNNILNPVENLQWKQVKCIAHSLNMAINSGLQQQKIKSIIIKVKTIIEYFDQNSEALAILEDNKKQLDLPALKLKQDTLTHWNSTYDMLSRFHTLKDAIIATLAIENPVLNFFSVEEWEIISICIEVLQFFQIVTESICSEEHIFLSKVPIYISSILDNLNEQITKQNVHCIKELCNIIKEEIESSFGNIETQELFAQATLLDPRIKSNGLSSQNAEEAIADLKQLCAKIKIDNDQNHQDVKESNEESHLDQSKTQLLWGKFDKKVKNLCTSQNSVSTSSIEIDKYLDEVLLDRNQDPLKWWKQRKDIYPRLYQVMLKRLCITATCVPCEKIFSEMGQIINDRRSRLKPEDFFSIAFLAHNLK